MVYNHKTARLVVSLGACVLGWVGFGISCNADDVATAVVLGAAARALP